jgi:hypothetical protein
MDGSGTTAHGAGDPYIPGDVFEAAQVAFVAWRLWDCHVTLPLAMRLMDRMAERGLAGLRVASAARPVDRHSMCVFCAAFESQIVSEKRGLDQGDYEFLGLLGRAYMEAQSMLKDWPRVGPIDHISAHLVKSPLEKLQRRLVRYVTRNLDPEL